MPQLTWQQCRLGPVTKNERRLYFHSFASTRESWVYSSVLQNKSLFENGLVDGSGTFFVSPEVRDTQSSVEVMTSDGILFFASMDNSLVCWNSQDQFASKNLYSVYKVSFEQRDITTTVRAVLGRHTTIFSNSVSLKKENNNSKHAQCCHELGKVLGICI